MTSVAGKTAFVTGGGSGVALGQAKALVKAGAKVAIADVRQDHLDEAAAWFAAQGTPVMSVKLDITDRAAYAQAADAVEERLGPVQMLFNTAGVSHFGPIQDATPEDWQWQIDVNLYGVINGIGTFLPRMLARGDDCHVVNTASMSAFVALPGCGIYTATKMAVRGLSESLNMDLAATKVRVSMLCPGAVRTNIHQSLKTRPAHLANTGYYTGTPEDEARLKQIIDIGMEPERLAGYVLEAMARDQFYILPYPEFRQPLEDIHAAVMACVGKPEDDPEYAMRAARGVPGGAQDQ
ncbi:MAG: SDR family NAD(P)-dependent oxidoreductase [Sphingomonadales bacterium]|nr:SDR family NAD(P)-dependent oxidoreductase [Sphingomonadales bacterium]